MGLVYENLEVQFAEGVDTKTNAKLVRRGKLLALENGSFREGGTIVKRNGYQALTKDVLASANDILSAVSLARYNDELLLLGKDAGAGAQLHLFSYSSGLTKWSDRGEIPPVRVRNDVILRNTYQQSEADCDTVNGVTVYAWADSRGGVRASVFDEATGAPLLTDTLIDAAGEHPRVVQVLRYVWVLYIDGTNLRARRIDSLSPTAFDAEVTLAVNVKATPARFDAVRYLGNPLGSSPTNSDVLFAYSNNAGGITAGFLLSDGAIGTALNGRPGVTVVAAENGERSIAIGTAPLGDSIVLMYANGVQGVRIVERNADLTAKSGPINVDAAATTATNVTFDFPSNTTATLLWETPAAATYNSFVETTTYTLGAPGSIGAVSTLKRGVGLGSKAFTKGTAPSPVYVVLLHSSSLQPTGFLVQVATAGIQAKILPSLSGDLNSGHLPRVVPKTVGSTYFYPALTRTKFVTEGNTTFSLIGVSKETLEFDQAIVSGQVGESLYLGGGIVSSYDGPSVQEAGFHLFPHDIVATPNAAGGSMASGTYQCVFVWTWINNRGEKERSAPSIPVSVVVTGPTGRIDFTVPTLRMTGKTGTRTNVQLECYTTQANLLVFYKTGNAAGSPTSAPVYNDPTVDTVSFQRTVADASIASNEILYTQGGILENIGPPAARLVTVGKDRVWLAGMEDPNLVLPSKRHVAGEGVAWSDLLGIRVDPQGGDISALAFMDDKCVVFKPSAIFVIAGDGPDDAGLNGQFTEPILVTTDVGCANPASIAVTADGLVFQSAKGRYLLTRSLQAVYFGAEVESSNDRQDTSAVLVDDQNQVRFTNSGDALVYDYLFRQWSTFTNHAAVGACIWDGSYVYVKADGTVMVETEDYFLDAGLDIHMRLETAWIKLNGLSGYQRVQRANFLGDFKSDHTLRVRTAFDYQPFSTEEHVFVPADALFSSYYGEGYYGELSPYGGNADEVYEFETHLVRQKCESVKFEIVDVGSNPGQAYSLSSLTLLVGLKPGTNREPATKKVA